MRKSYLVASVAALVLLLTLKPARAQVTDYFTFTNNSTTTWTSPGPVLGSGETLQQAGQLSVTAGHGSNGYYSAPTNSGSTFQEVWTSTDAYMQTCTFKSSATYSPTYGTWEFRVSKIQGAGPHTCNAGEAEANNTTSPAYTYYFSVSN